MIRIAFVALVAIPAVISAQTSRTDALINSALLKPGEDTVSVTVELPGGRTIAFGSALETLQRVKLGTREVWRQSYQFVPNNGNRTADTLWFEDVTLQPIVGHRHNDAHDADTQFRKSGAHTRLVPRSGAAQVSDTTIQGTLYASGQLAALIRAAPLALGYAHTYTLYYGPPNGIRLAPVQVKRSETVKSRAGQLVECWVVDAALSEGLSTFYVSKADRRVIRYVSHEDPSAAFVFTR